MHYIIGKVKAIVVAGVSEAVIIWIIATYIPSGFCLLRVSNGGRWGGLCGVLWVSSEYIATSLMLLLCLYC